MDANAHSGFSMPRRTCMPVSMPPTQTPNATAMVLHPTCTFRCARTRLSSQGTHVYVVCACVNVSRYSSGHHLRALHSRSSEPSYGQSNQPLHRNDLAIQVPKSHCHCLEVHTVTRAHGRERERKEGRGDTRVRRTRKVVRQSKRRRWTEVDRLTTVCVGAGG